MAAAGLVLASRLFVLTVAEAGKWRSAVEDMSVRAVYETAPRGDILDRNGDIIATSRKVYSVEMNGTDEEPLETAAAVIDAAGRGRRGCRGDFGRGEAGCRRRKM